MKTPALSGKVFFKNCKKNFDFWKRIWFLKNENFRIYLAYFTLGVPMVSLKKYHPIRSSRLAGFRGELKGRRGR